MCKKNQVKIIKKSTLEQKGFKTRFIKKLFSVENSDTEEFCKTCVTYIDKGEIPKLSLENGLRFPVVAEEIQKLNRVEERLLAPRHVFQTRWTVNGAAGQFKTKGGIVNVPVDMDTTVNHIPRAFDDSNMIHVKLARRMKYLNNYMSGNVRPKLLHNAAKKFILTPLALEEGIELSNDWYQDHSTNEHEYISHETDFYWNNAI
ncbi:Glutamyl-tRNA(Gln) amidotransferase subunit D [Frankliniella fusca]|uniref:Glutamyl-tRNA(Gln) amidotransferase subunit D n=1 Tax=Frankliniella fusca TaxID=407009 RepID=A0AAE1LVU4_9NEOP|nr:Glutamyl-tRNA(Gln) amidotransferase subunit D [Frankliniella fusca]